MDLKVSGLVDVIIIKRIIIMILDNIAIISLLQVIIIFIIGAIININTIAIIVTMITIIIVLFYYYYSALASLTQIAPMLEQVFANSPQSRRTVYEIDLFLQQSMATIKKLSGELIGSSLLQQKQSLIAHCISNFVKNEFWLVERFGFSE